MAFNIDLYKNNSPKIQIEKDLTSVSTVSGVLKDETSIIDPVVIIQVASVPGCNYAYIEQFGRYYYITDITSIRNGLWEISMHVDVYMSFADEIKSNSAVLARQQYLYNMYLTDNMLPLRAETITTDHRIGTAKFDYMTDGTTTYKNVLIVNGVDR